MKNHKLISLLSIGLSVAISNSTLAIAAEQTGVEVKQAVRYISIPNVYHGGRLVADDPRQEIEIYSEPSWYAESCGYGLYGDAVQILNYVQTEREGKWYLVRFPQSETICWVFERFLSPEF